MDLPVAGCNMVEARMATISLLVNQLQLIQVDQRPRHEIFLSMCVGATSAERAVSRRAEVAAYFDLVLGRLATRT